ncbi:hypothetical protein SRHO_G00335940 [Serrasalmus rhombeus]
MTGRLLRLAKRTKDSRCSMKTTSQRPKAKTAHSNVLSLADLATLRPSRHLAEQLCSRHTPQNRGCGEVGEKRTKDTKLHPKEKTKAGE